MKLSILYLHSILASNKCIYKDHGIKTLQIPQTCENISHRERVDCGYLGIKKNECQLRQCCWNPYNPKTSDPINNIEEENIPWCYYKASKEEYSCSIHNHNKHDCGFLGVDEHQCKQRGCCWNESNIDGVPWCFSKRRSCGGYKVNKYVDRPGYFTAQLQILNSNCHEFSTNIEELVFIYREEVNGRSRVKIYDKNHKRYEVPDYDNYHLNTNGNMELKFDFKFTKEPFRFQIIRLKDQMVIFDTNTEALLESLVFQDQYIEISTKLPPNSNIYGLSETVDSFKRNSNNTVISLWNRDIPTPTRENQYGAHPFYMELRDGKAHGVFLKNSNGMDILLQNGVLTYKVIGGILDFYFFSGSTPLDVVHQYTDLIGKPTFQPYWAFGFQQCRYGYKSLDEVEKVVSEFKKHNIPLETMWGDIDYMNQEMNFSLDPVNYPLNRMTQFIKELHTRGQKYVVILDPAIHIKPNYETYESGLEMNVFIKNKDGKPFTGNVWPGLTHFPDWQHPNTTIWWTKEIKKFIKLGLPIDGIWIDMNEPSNFCHGECFEQLPKNFFPNSIPAPLPKDLNPKNPNYNEPPYRIYNSKQKFYLHDKTLDMDALHYNGIHYNLHNLYGYHETISTYNALIDIHPKKRPFILTRSTFSGSGRYAGHWTGDNFSTWEHLKYSISSILSLQLFGISYVGADICGFIGATTEELCLRWMQLGSFYPFSRNHNAINEPSQEPYLWKSVTEASRNSLNIRYSLLSYFYTLNYLSNKLGNPLWYPMMFIAPQDPNTYDLDEQFLFGEAILIAPVLHEGQTKVNVYFTGEKWYDFYTYDEIQPNFEDEICILNDIHMSFRSSFWKVVDAPLQKVPMFLRGGHIISKQDFALTTDEVKNKDYELIVSLNDQMEAKGFVYLDDGISLHPKYNSIDLNANFKSFPVFFTSQGQFGFQMKNKLKKITFIGLTAETVGSKEGAKLKIFSNSSSREYQLVKGNSTNSLSVLGMDILFASDYSFTWN